MRRRSWGAILVPCVVAGCAGDSIAWEFTFEPLELRDDARVIEARVWQGGCDGDELAAYRFAPGERSAVAPAPLAAGRYGLSIEVRDAACRWFARGCSEVAVPSAETAVRVVVRPSTPREACPGACDVGVCAGE